MLAYVCPAPHIPPISLLSSQGLVRHFRPELERRMAEFANKSRKESTA